MTIVPFLEDRVFVPFLEDRVFAPQDIKAMSTAFEGLCETFNLPDEAKGERERLAKKIIARARQGDCSAALLRDGMLREIAYVRGGWAAKDLLGSVWPACLELKETP